MWVEAGLVNGALGYVENVVYMPRSKPPQLPLCIAVKFYNYIGFPFDPQNPAFVPIPLVVRGNRKQIPLKMAWALTIHKSQGLTLERASIYIGTVEHQGMTFTAIF